MSSSAVPAPALRLADHVRACCADEQIILLDLRRNRYVGVSAQPSLAGVVGDWPGAPQANTPFATLAQRAPLLAPLLAQGLLTDQPKAIRRPQQTLPTPARSLNADEAPAQLPIGWRRAGRFYRSAAAASLRLRCQTLASIAEAVATRQPGASMAMGSAPRCAVQDAVAAYQRLRLFTFTAHDRCLQDALTLVCFLASEGIAAHWAIGVRTRPFGAHSWVQIGDAVLNDQHEQVRRYTSILVV